MRESPTFRLLDLLQTRGASVAYYDPYIPVIGPTREHVEWRGFRSVAWNRRTLGAFDLVLISTAHKAVNYRELGRWAKLVVDTRNAMAGLRVPKGKVWKG
jgi:UDP-N-acetyl-D-glucosamine dehydrogenase